MHTGRQKIPSRSNQSRRGCVVTMPTCRSTLKMRLLEPSSYSLDRTSFSTPNTTPSLQRIAIAVLQHTQADGGFSDRHISTLSSVHFRSTGLAPIFIRTSLANSRPYTRRYGLSDQPVTERQSCSTASQRDISEVFAG